MSVLCSSEHENTQSLSSLGCIEGFHSLIAILIPEKEASKGLEIYKQSGLGSRRCSRGLFLSRKDGWPLIGVSAGQICEGLVLALCD